MRTTSRQGQWLADIALREAGSIEAVVDMAVRNNISITGKLSPGTELLKPAPIDRRVMNYYGINGIWPGTKIDALSPEEIIDRIERNDRAGTNLLQNTNQRTYKHTGPMWIEICSIISGSLDTTLDNYTGDVVSFKPYFYEPSTGKYLVYAVYMESLQCINNNGVNLEGLSLTTELCGAYVSTRPKMIQEPSPIGGEVRGVQGNTTFWEDPTRIGLTLMYLVPNQTSGYPLTTTINKLMVTYFEFDHEPTVSELIYLKNNMQYSKSLEEMLEDILNE